MIEPTYASKAAVERRLQKNVHDCGAYVCAFALCLCHGLPVTTFDDTDMVFIRNIIFLSILRKEVLDIVTFPTSL